MLGLTFLTEIWICRSLLGYTFTVCVILNFSKRIYLEAPSRHQSNKHKINTYYWQIPTFQCDTHKINFTALATKYGFIQNPNNRFWGKEINILYDPGNFPAILKNSTRNGGVPQEGNLTDHLKIFNKFLNEMIPDKSFSGIGIIDFEGWRPIFRQNFGKLSEIKTLSLSIEKQKHPSWSINLLKKEATKRFENSARKFMESTLLAAKLARPKASWGYYGYPYCFNKSPNNMKTQCPKEVLNENDRLKLFFKLEDNFYPSLYLGNLKLNASDKVQMIEGRIEESLRIIKNVNVRKNIIPYFWYKYQDTNEFIKKQDLFSAFTVLASSNINGLILWGSSNDVNTKKKCLELYQYIDDILGPLITYNF